MTGRNGLDLQKCLEQLRHSLPIVFLTGHGDVAKSLRAIKAGAEDFFLKRVTKAKSLETYTKWQNDHDTSLTTGVDMQSQW
jgi:FixJ family two-component response regulator